MSRLGSRDLRLPIIFAKNVEGKQPTHRHEVQHQHDGKCPGHADLRLVHLPVILTGDVCRKPMGFFALRTQH